MLRFMCTAPLLIGCSAPAFADEKQPPHADFHVNGLVEKVVLENAKLRVIEGRTQVIIPATPAVCAEAFLFRYNNGDLLAAIPINRGKGAYRRSTDGGRTWQESPVTTVNEGGAAYQYLAPDDEVISWPGADIAPRVLKQPGDPDGLWEYQIDFYRSQEHGLTQTAEQSVVHMPEAQLIVPDHSIVQLADGSLLAAVTTHLVRRGRNVSPTGHLPKWWISYEFDRPHHLTELLVFNGGDAPGIGIGDVEIFSTVDGDDWQRVFAGRFHANPDGKDFPSVAYDIDDRPARQVVLEISSNLGLRFDHIVQLAEIRFRETDPESERSRYLEWNREIVGVSASSAHNQNLVAENSVNRHGMLGDRHTTVESGMWQASSRKQQTAVVRSTDRGRTWTYLATVADGDESLYPEGFNEPDLLVLPDGKVLCIMRTGATICLSRSSDSGATWSEPREVPNFYRVWPNLILTESGVVAAFAGRPNNWITFSVDGGNNWSAPLQVGEPNLPAGCDCTHYNGIAQVAPNRLLAVYCETVDGKPCTVRMMGTWFTVQRK